MIALSPATPIPNQRPAWPPRQIENAAKSCATPRMSVIQPHVLRLLKTKVALATKNFELSIAAIPR